MTDASILTTVLFYIFAALIVLGAIFTIVSNRIIYSLCFAVIVFFTVAGIFFMLGAEYNAVIQIAIYGIAIPILFIFAIMFTADKFDKKTYLTFSPRFSLSIISGALFIVTIFNIVLVSSSAFGWIFTRQTDVVINHYQMFNAISKGLYVDYILAFELVSLLLLVIIVGISTLNLFKEKKRG